MPPHQVLSLENAYLDALCQDLDQEAALSYARPIATVFIGGGTPSLFSPAGIARLLAHLQTRFAIDSHAEITLEANPGTVDRMRLAGFRAAGVNRLSLGIQSFHDGQLVRLGRIHDRTEAIAAFEMARQVGYDNINLDLMFGLPGQYRADAAQDLTTAIALAPEHISYYQLTLEPATAFYRNPPSLPEEEDCWAIQEQGIALLAAAGYAQYEISAYARPGRRCSHNLNYWEFGDYLGVGAGAHGKITSTAGICRRWKHSQPQRYLDAAHTSAPNLGREHPKNPYVAGEEWVRHADLPAEFLLNALRLVDGVPAQSYAPRTGLSLAPISDKLALARAQGWLAPQEDRLVATTRGRQFLNDVLERFLSDNECESQ